MLKNHSNTAFISSGWYLMSTQSFYEIIWFVAFISLLLMKTFMVEAFNNLCKITVADAHMKSTDLKVLLCMYIRYGWQALGIVTVSFFGTVVMWVGHMILMTYVRKGNENHLIFWVPTGPSTRLQSSLQSYSLMILSHIVWALTVTCIQLCFKIPFPTTMHTHIWMEI